MPQRLPQGAPRLTRDAGIVLRSEDVADRVRLLTLDRPAVANAFDAALYDACAAALAEAATDDAVSVVVLAGAGRVFSAGVDLVEMGALVAGVDGDGNGLGRAFREFLDGLVSFPKPLVAAVNGAAVGIGFTMLLHCDVVLVSELARFKTPFTEMGVAPEAASSYLLPRRLGWPRAALALLGSEWLSAADAVDAGLAVRIVPADALLAEAIALAEQLARHPLASLVATKRLMREPEREGVARARQAEDAAFAELLARPGAHASVMSQLPGRSEPPQSPTPN